MAEALKAPTPALAELRPEPPSIALRRFGSANKHHYGEDALIGIIDVQGFDFSHPDFLDAQGRTRFLRIWDQGGDARPSPEADGQFSYGAEFRAPALNGAIAASPGLGLPATDIEKQSQSVEGSHGTHVASIAAGNRGVCRKASIVAVLVSLPKEDEDRRLSFYDSSRLADGVDYLLGIADELKKPISINVSLGTNGHSHDGSAAVTRWIDAALSTPGRAPSPSQDDCELTKRLVQASDILGIPLLDHVIVGGCSRHYSFRESGLGLIRRPVDAEL
jgi:hypothetical protein